MCYRPLTLRNPSRYYNSDCDPLYVTVPCGHCSECENNKRNAYYVRAWYEFQNTLKFGGLALFVTLTYNNNCLPFFEYNDIKLPCLCKKDVQKFTNRIQEKLRRINPDYSLKYIISSEYGEKRLRPHYHGVLFFNAPLSLQNAISLVQKAWTFGISAGGKFGWQVLDFRAIKYACKYVCKDIGYLHSKLREVAAIAPLYLTKMLLPFHLQSKGFGISAVESIKTDQYNISIPEDGMLRQYPIPQYIYRKRFMTLQYRPSKEHDRNNPTYLLNYDGFLNRYNKFDIQMNELHKRFVGRVNQITDKVFADIRHLLPLPLSLQGFKDYTDKMVNAKNFFDFVLFSSTFKHLRSGLSPFYDELRLKNLRDLLLRRVYSFDYTNYIDIHDNGYYENKFFKTERTFSHLNKYRDFSIYQKIYDVITAYFGTHAQRNYDRKTKQILLLKQLYGYT